MSFQIKRGTNAQRLAITPLSGELIYTTDTDLLYIGDGTTPGGILVGDGISGNSGGVRTLNGLSGGITLSAGSGISLVPSGNIITVNNIASSGLTNYVESFNGLTGAVTGVTTGTANIFNQLQTFTKGISFTGQYLPEIGLTGSILSDVIVVSSGMVGSAWGAYSPLSNSIIRISTGMTGPAGTGISSLTGTIVIGNTWYNKSTDDCINIGSTNLYTALLAGNLTTGSVVVGNRNLQKLTATNNITVFGMDNLNSITAPDANITLVGRNLCTGVSSADNLTAFGTNIGNAGTNKIDNSVLFGYRTAGGSGVTAINNVIIGSGALDNNSGAGGTCASTSNNIIIGYQSLKFLNAFNNNTQLGLNNSVIIASAYEPSNSELDNVAIAENQALGHTQLLIGSGKTAWITGSCFGYVGIGGVTTPLGELHVQNRIVLNPASAPATSTSAGVTGSIAWDNDFLYVCARGNSWRRAPLSGYV
jgi:hypothetical protein